MQLSGLVTLEPTEGPVLANLADMAGDAFLEELWTQELLSALPETSRGPDRERFLSRAIILSDLAVGTPYQCGYCTPDGKGLMIGFRNSELAPQTWEALEEKGWKDLCKSVLSIEEQEALNKQLERMAPISVFDYPEKTHKHDDFIHLIMFAVAPTPRAPAWPARCWSRSSNWPTRRICLSTWKLIPIGWRDCTNISALKWYASIAAPSSPYTNG